ncbi:patatin-like phospholipase family protein [Methylopila turkensis]|uniref:patatin-like phospholipase family protein n=1 Tax=Methylopila turkensis TaxID=1437816 RepID=UPI0022F31FF6|nr:patatin-like phospholipase family protein [Methylopila turkensis]
MTADADAPEPTAPQRPTLALALGGGAARGWAHIGVLRSLEKAGLAPDVIAGTSIGAVVGGCWAAGKLDELEAWALSLTPRRMFGMLDLRIAGAGLISGGRLRAQLETHLADAAIEDLGLRFVAIATEFGTGHEVWLGRGRLSTALRASYALPGILEPVRIGGRWLMDGALVNPVPVSAARALGGRLVVAVNLQSEMSGRGTVIQAHAPTEEDEAAVETVTRVRRRMRFRRRRPTDERPPLAIQAPQPGAPGIPAVMVEAFNIAQDRISRSRLAGDPPDVMIGPRLGRFGLFEFHRAADAIKLGAQAADRAIDSIRDCMNALA